MGKTASCFKLITCGGGTAEKDDYHQVSEIKDSNDKRGWSFQKKSARHCVLSNTVAAEAPSSANKESSECTSFNFQQLPEPNAVEKIYTTHSSDEKPQLSSLESSQMSETIVETESKADVNPPDSAVIIIQAAIRGLLALKDLVQRKNVVKLQAAVRGHLVRRHAVGTLRCVQAIIKMQVLVRARHAQLSHPEDHSSHWDGKNDSSKTLENENHLTKSNVTYSSIEKLLSNKFACQLLESAPKNKPIYVKCNPAKADSAWKWLERWMSVTSKDTAVHKKTSSLTEQLDKSKSSISVSHCETGIPSEVLLQSVDTRPTVGDSLLPSGNEEKLTSYVANSPNIQASCSTSSLVKDNLEHVPPQTSITYNAKVKSAEIDSFQNEKLVSDVSAPPEINSFQNEKLASDASAPPELNCFQNEKLASDANAPSELNSLPQKPVTDGEQRKQSMKRFASDQLEAEGKRSINGSRKVSNPAFLAAQSKFEELSSMANSGRTSSLSNQEAVESQADTSFVGTDTAYRSKEFLSENPVLYLSRVGGSECGTEISISSTLDSPDISEAGTRENEQDSKDLVEGIGNLENIMNHDVEINVPYAIPASSSATSVLDKSETVDDIRGSMVHSVVALDSGEPTTKTEKSASDPQREQAEVVLQDLRSSPEASPRSHMTVPESQETPSSQVSIKPKEGKINKTGSSNKRGTLLVGNKSPANANHDTSSRGSREQLPKDQRSGKRRNSFGSVKPDHVDQEPRDNGSNNDSLPHFMQATESARAKINSNNSPRSSPDVHERDIQVKKRHSLPGVTGRQVSPCIQRSMSQAQQTTKGNGVQPPQDRKWLR